MKNKTSLIVMKLALLSCVLIFLSFAVQAKEGFYLGFGMATQSGAGDLDGKKYYSNDENSPTELILVGDLSSGSGYAIDIGYGINDFVAIDYLLSSTSHTSEHELITVGDNTSAANLTTALLGVKLSAPIGDSQDLIFRLGLSSCILEYEDFALIGYRSGNEFSITDQKSVEYSGSGFGAGLGIEFFFDKIGLELGYTLHSVTFTEAKTSSTEGLLSEDVAATISSLNILLAYHF